MPDGPAQVGDSGDGPPGESVGLLTPDAPQAARGLRFDLLEPTPGACRSVALDLPDLTTLDVDLAYLLVENGQVLVWSGPEFAMRYEPTR